MFVERFKMFICEYSLMPLSENASCLDSHKHMAVKYAIHWQKSFSSYFNRPHVYDGGKTLLMDYSDRLNLTDLVHHSPVKSQKSMVTLIPPYTSIHSNMFYHTNVFAHSITPL